MQLYSYMYHLSWCQKSQQAHSHWLHLFYSLFTTGGYKIYKGKEGTEYLRIHYIGITKTGDDSIV